ncbi:hypothetical protein RHMOL_Rhmol04G0274000 [Rhododendron molle]|uniref:Uncharacterized protein n=2 Tax=Rhododendron molle TaxID=49168 RepID=A0ACC0P4W1_RHOML|nr:hypothetical protein RHMOL_Rhmol04G0274000 [Rhododendron molle]KAI8560646.1 hypothetical protein RHMOL_Rhmol04G0274000 [Rhododendron molle]
MTSLSHSPVTFTWNFASSTSASDLLHSSHNSVIGVPLKSLGRARVGISRKAFTVSAKLFRRKKRHSYPWDGEDRNPKTDGELCRAIHPFKPLKEKPKPVILDFEKPLVALREKMIEVQKRANETGVDLSDLIVALENKYQQVLKAIYTRLTPIQRVYIARHPHRPTSLDHIFNITDNVFLELHGDRHGYDDPSIVCGLGRMDDKTYMFIAHQKGRNTKESIHRNFGMPTPHGYRKALRFMHMADHHGWPIVTLIDTPGAFADLKSEALNQGEAIAHNLMVMFGLKVPIISVVIGEGGSGGALAIGCANKLIMLENAVFYVASPEACAAIVWKTAKEAPRAARKLRITARELCRLKIADGIIREPLGGAHTDPHWTSQQIKKAILISMDELTKLDTQELLKHRQAKFRQMGRVGDGVPLDPYKKRNMKKREAKEGFHFKKRILDPKESSMSNEISEAVNLSESNKKECKLEPEVDVKSKGQQSENGGVSEESKDEKVVSEISKKECKLEQEADVKCKDVESENEVVSGASEDDEVDEEFFEESEDEGVDETSEDEEVDEEFFEESEDEGVNREYDDFIDLADINGEVDEEFEDVLDQSEIDKKIEALKKEIDQVEDTNYELKDVFDQPETEKKVEALRKEIENSGASSLEDLTQDLKDKLLQLKEEVKSELVGDGKASGLHINHSLPLSEFRARNIAINCEIEHAVNNSPDLTAKMERLDWVVKKAGKHPDSETRKKIRVLQREIKQGIDEALKSSEKYQKLVAERSEQKVVEMVGMLPNLGTLSEILLAKRKPNQGMEEALNSSGYKKLMEEISGVNESSGEKQI